MSTGESPTRSSPRSLRQLWAKVRGVEIAMLTTLDTDGTFRSRPMATQAIESDEFLWFFAARDSGKVAALRANPQVGLVYASPADHLYVMASGKASVSDNDAKARELWSKAAQEWFPGGPADSGLVLICVDVDEAEWWDGMESRPLDLG
ncbi:MAG: pyridoxamine 5'-phosphate oxidase family protein [Gammaproteobacteria bacterium]|nr:pyridoxamine 5'-phosphate oxidase family protein [Gammaproteobacteria bacterium]